MRLLRDLPLTRKLTGITLLSGGVALVLTCAAFIACEQVAFRRDMTRELDTTARIIGANIASSLSNENNDSANLTLQSLSEQPSVLRGCAYDSSGKLFAAYRRVGEEETPWPEQRPATSFFDRDSLQVFHSIPLAGETVGTLYLQSDLGPLHARRWSYLAAAGVVLLAAQLVTWLIASRLQRLITDPIARLAAVAGRVGAENTYSIRAIKQGDDEIGRLVDGFNTMLAQIEARDAELHAAHKHLEQRAEERTRSLEEAREEASREKARFQFIFDHAPVGISLHSWVNGVPQASMINDAHLRICGLAREELADESVFRKISHPDDYARQIPLQARMERGEIDRFSIEKRYLRADGEVVWVVFSARRQAYPEGRVESLVTIVDITELKRAQEATAREHERFKFIFESLPVGVSLSSQSRDGAPAFLINDAQLHIVGVSRETALADRGVFNRLTHPDDYARQLPLREKFRSGEIDRYTLEKRYVRPDGESVWVAFSTERKTYPDGRSETLSVVVDITALKLAQEEAAREQARLKFIFDSVPVGISLYSGTRDNLHASFLINDAHLAICGVSRSRAEAEPDIFARLSHPDDYARQAPLNAALLSGETDRYSIEKRYLRPDGRVAWVVFSAQRMSHPDGRVDTLGTVVDITELKLAQEETARERSRFKFIFESLPVGVSWGLVDSEASLVVNPAHERITGVSASESSDRAAFSRVTHPEDRARQAELVGKLNRGEIDHFVIEKRYLHPDGRVVWAVLMSRIWTDPETGSHQAVTTLVDITERKRAEAELEQIHKQLLHTSHQAGMAEVATGVLHNVGNVLNSVNVSATLVADLVRRSKSPNVAKVHELLAQNAARLGPYLTEDPKGRLIPAYLATLAESLAAEQKTIVAELDSLHKNIGHIKDIVAMQQSYAKTSGVVETVSVPDLVEDAIRMNAGSLARHDVQLARRYDGRPVITVEKNKVLQILVNLIRNAKYACDESGRADKLITLRTTSDDLGVDIAVIDNGVGIPPENLTRIFAHGFTTRKHGHGFGLHSGALAAKELGGALTARSEGRGLGATFTLTLPLGPAHDSP